MLGVGVRAAIVLAATSDGAGVSLIGRRDPAQRVDELRRLLRDAAKPALGHALRAAQEPVVERLAQPRPAQRRLRRHARLDLAHHLVGELVDVQYVSPVSSVSVTCAIA